MFSPIYWYLYITCFKHPPPDSTHYTGQQTNEINVYNYTALLLKTLWWNITTQPKMSTHIPRHNTLNIIDNSVTWNTLTNTRCLMQLGVALQATSTPVFEIHRCGITLITPHSETCVIFLTVYNKIFFVKKMTNMYGFYWIVYGKSTGGYAYRSRVGVTCTNNHV